jgi:hypothetical protein
MRGFETVLYVAAFFSELTAGGLISFDIRVNRQLRSELLSKSAPFSDALDGSSGVLMWDTRDLIRANETKASQEKANNLHDAICRQRWAFRLLVIGAVAGLAGNMLVLWVG